jgi:hypothetical protein
LAWLGLAWLGLAWLGLAGWLAGWLAGLHFGSLQADLEKSSQSQKFANWRARSAEMRYHHGLSADASPYTQLAGVQLRGVPRCDRVHDLLNVAFMLRRDRNPNVPIKDLLCNFWANPSQNIARKPWSDHPATLTQSAELYSFEHDAVLSGHAHLRGMGFPTNMAPIGFMSEYALRQLAGEAYSVPVMSLLLSAVFMIPDAPWWKQEH